MNLLTQLLVAPLPLPKSIEAEKATLVVRLLDANPSVTVKKPKPVKVKPCVPVERFISPRPCKHCGSFNISPNNLKWKKFYCGKCLYERHKRRRGI